MSRYGASQWFCSAKDLPLIFRYSEIRQESFELLEIRFPFRTRIHIAVFLIPLALQIENGAEVILRLSASHVPARK
jgi:hypothetical protein